MSERSYDQFGLPVTPAPPMPPEPYRQQRDRDDLQQLNQSLMRQILDQASETARLNTRIEELEAQLYTLAQPATDHPEPPLEMVQPPEDWAQLMTDLYLAALGTAHEIDSNRVTLHYDAQQTGHNAANQLLRRLQSALPPFPVVPAFTHVAQHKK